MLLSMTGHGEAHRQQDALYVAIEVRTVNSRHFKLIVRGSEHYCWLEPQIESTVRKYIRRGTVQVLLEIDREATPEDYQLNEAVLAGYRQQLKAFCDRLGVAEPAHPELLLALPGVVEERAGPGPDAQKDWPLIEQALVEALDSLEKMRVEEGHAMAADLASNCHVIASRLEQIQQRAPQVVDGYRRRLRERLRAWLSEIDVPVEDADLVREVGLFAERSDISEEVVRLRSHLEQFDAVMGLDQSSGRKLEFLTQEMFREANTIGSKANDVEISRHVIEVKAAIERMREMIQNVE